MFHTLSTRVFEQLDGIAKLSSVQGRVLSELNNGAHRPPSAGFRATPRVSHSEMTAPQPIKSIHNSGVSRETYSQAHLRLPKPPQPPLSKDLVAPSRSSHAPASPLPGVNSASRLRARGVISTTDTKSWCAISAALCSDRLVNAQKFRHLGSRLRACSPFSPPGHPLLLRTQSRTACLCSDINECLLSR